MKRREIGFGPGVALLILIIFTVGMSLLSLLTLMSAGNDWALSRRSARTSEEIYGLFAEAQCSLAELDVRLAECAAEAEDDADYLNKVAGALPEGMTLRGREAVWSETIEGRELRCAAGIAPLGEMPRATFTEHRLNAEAGKGWDDMMFDEPAFDESRLLPTGKD